MTTKIICFLTALALAPVAYAQKIKGAAGFLRLGYTAAPGSANAFEKIAPEGVADFTNNYFAMGADGYYRTGRIILGLDGLLGVQGDHSSGTQHSEPFVGSGHARFGWIVKEDERYWLYPSLGTGTAFAILNSYNKIGETKLRQDRILFSPSFDFGFNGDFIVSPSPGERRKYGAFLMGFRVGYRVSFRNNNWVDEDGDEFEYNPYYTNNAFYVTISIGGGWFAKRDVQ